jgi:hypothetical protein
MDASATASSALEAPPVVHADPTGIEIVANVVPSILLAQRVREHTPAGTSCAPCCALTRRELCASARCTPYHRQTLKLFSDIFVSLRCVFRLCQRAPREQYAIQCAAHECGRRPSYERDRYFCTQVSCPPASYASTIAIPCPG